MAGQGMHPGDPQRGISTRANAYAVNRDASELRRSPARKAPASAQPGPMHVIYMSVHTGIQAAHRADNHVQVQAGPPECQCGRAQGLGPLAAGKASPAIAEPPTFQSL